MICGISAIRKGVQIVIIKKSDNFATNFNPTKL